MPASTHRYTHECKGCGAIGSEDPCWYCGGTDLKITSARTGGHRNDPGVHSVSFSDGREPLSLRDVDTVLPWQV